MADYRTGEQPCHNFKPFDSLFPASGNVHQCLAPFDSVESRCGDNGGTVSYCDNCNLDHHSGGYETCLARIPAPLTEGR